MSTPRTDAVVPEGWQLVPKQPTDSMRSAAISRFGANDRTSFEVNGWTIVLGMYQQMLAYAPEPPVRVSIETNPGENDGWVKGLFEAGQQSEWSDKILCDREGIDKLETELQSAEAKLAVMAAAFDRASYALFQIKRMVPEAITEFARAEHTVACDVIDKLPERAQRLQEFLQSFAHWREGGDSDFIAKWRAYQGDSDG